MGGGWESVPVALCFVGASLPALLGNISWQSAHIFHIFVFGPMSYDNSALLTGTPVAFVIVLCIFPVDRLCCCKIHCDTSISVTHIRLSTEKHTVRSVKTFSQLSSNYPIWCIIWWCKK